ncbi:MAG TPA: hypothetical protein VN765_03460 [Candidatus Acidoferrum sp.]|nr:hypothetical protein [Candidatus Acidoferrum sp.]
MKDRKRIVLDGAIGLKPDTRVKVITIENNPTEAEMISGCACLSESVFQKTWDNPLDADYDKL